MVFFVKPASWVYITLKSSSFSSQSYAFHRIAYRKLKLELWIDGRVRRERGDKAEEGRREFRCILIETKTRREAKPSKLLSTLSLWAFASCNCAPNERERERGLGDMEIKRRMELQHWGVRNLRGERMVCMVWNYNSSRSHNNLPYCLYAILRVFTNKKQFLDGAIEIFISR